MHQFSLLFSVQIVKWESNYLKRVTKTVGDSVIFDCRLSEPSARVKLKQKISSGVVVERFTDGCRVSRTGQKFVIHAVNFNDFGIYFCEAPQVKIKRKQEAYLNINPGKVRNEFAFLIFFSLFTSSIPALGNTMLCHSQALVWFRKVRASTGCPNMKTNNAITGTVLRRKLQKI